MRLQTKVFVTTAIIFLLHFSINLYIGQQQIQSEVVANIKENARTIRGMLMAYRGVYQKIFLEHNVPINDTTIQFLPAYAISRISHDFTQWVDNGLTFNNVSDRPRNPSNKADAIEMEAMNVFRLNPELKERFVSYTTPDGEKYFHFSQPIIIKPRCMKCHGKKEEVPNSIQRRYDTAYNYSIGDLRGVMSIKLPARIIEQRTNELFKRTAIIHLLIMLLVFVLIAILMNRTVLSRIKALQFSSNRLASGEYDTQIDLSGNDELTHMGHSFNRMAQTIAQREQSLLKQKSLYYALSQTNKSIVQLNSEEELFDQICQIATSQPNLVLAWVGIADKEHNELVVVSRSGKAQLCLDHIKFYLLNDSSQPTGPVVNAYHNSRIVIINDYLNDPATSTSQDYASQANIKAIASFPITKNKEVIGVFSVYANEPGFFSNDIIDLLHEMTNDVEYAIKHYELQQQHIESQQQLQHSSQKLSELNDLMSMLLESTGEGIFGVDTEGCCTFVNHAALEMFGFALSELKGHPMHELTHHSHKDGSRFPYKQCPIYEAYHSGQSCRIENEVFWRKDGTSFPVHYSAYPIRDEKQMITGSVTVFRDITESQAMTRKMNFLASHDVLTSLFNRYSFEQKLTQALESAQSEGAQHAVCYLDLDQFKVVNDTCGHLAGDEMLKMIARILKDNVRKNDILSRLGGDEFGLLLEDCSLKQATALAKNICAELKDFHFIWEDKVFSTGASIGISAITASSESVQSIMSDIDSACYIAKERGRNRVHVHRFNDTDTAKHHGEMRWISEIRKALEDERFLLYQQQIVASNPASQSEIHFEILLRMIDSDGDIIPPGAFLPAAERYDLMAELDRWVIRATFKWLSARNPSKGRVDFCSINLSGQSIGDEQLYQFIMAQKQAFNIAPQSICFEITESTAITRLEQAIQFIRKLSDEGFLFALDDFGTGMSSFAYLKNLPVNYLKIDGSFVKDIIDDPIDRAMVKSINDIGHIMGLKTIAEYVENDAIRQSLIEMNIDYLQGYGIAQPEPCNSLDSDNSPESGDSPEQLE